MNLHNMMRLNDQKLAVLIGGPFDGGGVLVNKNMVDLRLPYNHHNLSLIMDLSKEVMDLIKGPYPAFSVMYYRYAPIGFTPLGDPTTTCVRLFLFQREE